MLHHVALEVREQDTDAEVAFWATLGFDEVAPPPTLAGRTRWVQRGEQQVHLLFTEAPTIPPQGHVAVVGTVEGLPDAEPRAEHWGSPRFLVRSPAGHRVEVMHFPPR